MPKKAAVKKKKKKVIIESVGVRRERRANDRKARREALRVQRRADKATLAKLRLRDEKNTQKMFAIIDGIRRENEWRIVNHPPHYNSHPSGIECIAVTEHMNFNVGNAIKYLWRSDMKNGLEDLKKAAWYVNREIKRIEQKNENQSGTKN